MADAEERKLLLGMSPSMQNLYLKSKKGPPFVPIWFQKQGYGFICLWHFPAKKHIKQAKKNGCDVIVTLQGETENDKMKSLHKWCEAQKIEHFQIDFWKNWYRKECNKNIVNLLNEIKQRLERQEYVLIHCAAGIHRTGIFCFLLLRMIGFDKEAAYEYLGTIRETTRENVGDTRIDSGDEFFMSNQGSLRLSIDSPSIPEETKMDTMTPPAGLRPRLKTNEAGENFFKAHKINLGGLLSNKEESKDMSLLSNKHESKDVRKQSKKEEHDAKHADPVLPAVQFFFE